AARIDWSAADDLATAASSALHRILHRPAPDRSDRLLSEFLAAGLSAYARPDAGDDRPDRLAALSWRRPRRTGRRRAFRLAGATELETGKRAPCAHVDRRVPDALRKRRGAHRPAVAVDRLDCGALRRAELLESQPARAHRREHSARKRGHARFTVGARWESRWRA